MTFPAPSPQLPVNSEGSQAEQKQLAHWSVVIMPVLAPVVCLIFSSMVSFLVPSAYF